MRPKSLAKSGPELCGGSSDSGGTLVRRGWDGRRDVRLLVPDWRRSGLLRSCCDRLRRMLPIALELEAHRLGLRFPALGQIIESHVLLGATGSQRRQFHSLGRRVPVGPRSLLDRLPPLRERTLDVVRDRRDAEAITNLKPIVVN